MIKKLLLLTALPVLLFACTAEKTELSFPEKIEQAHQKEAFLQKEGLQFDFLLYFGGVQRMNASIKALPDLSKIRIDLDSLSLIYDGENVYQTPSDVNYPRARFDMFTWTYFMAMPYKLTDPGTVWTDVPFDTLNGAYNPAQKLSFEPGTGDSPDDWYIVYADPDTYQMQTAAYIVTFSADQEEAEQNPHAIVYKDYVVFEGIPISTTWEFTNWSEETDLGSQIGDAKLSNINFGIIPDSVFQKPEDAKLITLN